MPLSEFKKGKKYGKIQVILLSVHNECHQSAIAEDAVLVGVNHPVIGIVPE